MSIKISSFGVTKNGSLIKQFTITNGKLEVDLINFGATIRSIRTKDKNDVTTDIVLGFDNISDYEQNNPYLGSTVGRFCNRIANGTFTLNDKIYKLATNNGPNALHGGNSGFSHNLWFAEAYGENSVRMLYVSKDGEEGYPGELTVEVIFTLTDIGALEISYSAKTDNDTIINLTNHTYFNLDGYGLILDHFAQINSTHFLPTDVTNIPTGEIRTVKNSAFDFSTFHKLGSRINDDCEQIIIGSGYDHTYIISGNLDETIAVAYSEKSGIKLSVSTTQPGVQLYTGNWLQDTIGKNGLIYHNRSGFCFETQHWPDSPNQPSFPSTILKSGEEFKSKTIYKFSLI